MATTKYKIGNQFIYHPKKNTLTPIDDKGSVIILGANEGRLLNLLISNRGAVARDELITTLWNDREIFVDNSSLTQCVSTLRKALDDSSKEPQFIKTVPKLGYEFIAEVEQIGGKKKTAPKESCQAVIDDLGHSEGQIVGLSRPHLLVLNSLLLRLEVFLVIIAVTLCWNYAL